MTQKTVWHTDIVVRGHGMNIKVVAPPRGGCYRVEVMTDTSGAAAARAKKEFLKSAGAGRVCFASASGAKGSVERGVARTKARWNKWHRESY